MVAVDEHDAGPLGERLGRQESEAGELRTELHYALRRVNRLLVIGFFLTYTSLSAPGPESRTLVRAGLPLVAAVIGEATPFCASARTNSGRQ